MSLQLTPFDPYALRPAVLPASEPPLVAPVAAAGASVGTASDGNAAGGRSSPEPSAAGAPPGRSVRTRGVDRPAAIDPAPVPSTVSLGKVAPSASDGGSGQRIAAGDAAGDPPPGRVPAEPETPMSQQMVEFLQSMWKAGAQAIALPEAEDARTVAGVAAPAGARGAAPDGAPRAAVPADAGRPSGARTPAASARIGDPPALGNALDDPPAATVPAAAPLVYADPTLRRPSGG